MENQSVEFTMYIHSSKYIHIHKKCHISIYEMRNVIWDTRKSIKNITWKYSILINRIVLNFIHQRALRFSNEYPQFIYSIIVI